MTPTAICGHLMPRDAYDPWPGNATPRICQLSAGHGGAHMDDRGPVVVAWGYRSPVIDDPDARYRPDEDLTLSAEVERIRDCANAPLPVDAQARLYAMEDRMPRLAAWLRQLADDLDN